MSKEAVDAYAAEIERVTEHFRMEWKINYAEAIGVLSIEKDRLTKECRDSRSEGEDRSEQ